MNQCENCGQGNAPESQFCRFCGTRFTARQPAPQQGYDYEPPRPYGWKTDEYQTHTDARRTAQHHLPNAEPLAPRDPHFISAGYRCPHCGTGYLPVVEKRISTAGWVTFAVLLVVTVIFFWIGLLMKEDVRICPVCKQRV